MKFITLESFWQKEGVKRETRSVIIRLFMFFLLDIIIMIFNFNEFFIIIIRERLIGSYETFIENPKSQTDSYGSQNTD